MSSEKSIQLGFAAKALLEDENFKIFIDSVRVDAYRDWSTSNPEEKEKREDAYQLFRAISKLEDNMTALAGNAVYEQKKAEREDELKKLNEEQPKGE